VDAVIQKVSDTIYAVVEDIIEEPNIGGIFMGDDLGHFSGTFVSPKVLRKKFFPHTASIVDLAHSAGKIFILHSCGNIQDVMDDLIEMGIDAKHSYEDKIMPVEEAYARYGDRIGIIGGIDVNTMAGGSEEDVRDRTRQVLDSCASRGRYVLGTGNSIANYIPLHNYLAMVDEAKKWNMQNFGREW
jgi:uroporphyrinogen decarboxylase